MTVRTARCTDCGQTLTQADSVSQWISEESGPRCPARVSIVQSPEAPVHRAEPIDSALARAGYLTVAPPAAPPIGWSSHDPDID